MAFSDICGQDVQIRILKRALERGRVPHAYLFYGMKGVGKKTTAHVLAKALNCREGRHDSCDTCPSCVKADHGNHTDILVIEPEGLFIKVEPVRDMQRQMKFRPVEGKKRVSIIVDAEKLNDVAANTLLKTLEEPTGSNILILTTSHLSRVMPTIASRCQKIRFSPVRHEAVEAFLAGTRAMARERAALLASSSGGSIGKALELDANPEGAFRQEFVEAYASMEGGAVTPAVFTIAHELAEDKQHLLPRLDVMRSWLRDMLVYRETQEAGRLIHRDVEEATKTLSARIPSARLLKSIQAVQEAAAAIAGNANRQLALESMMFKITRA